MIPIGKFEKLLERDLVADVRVVPVPFDRTWCIDTVVRTPLEAGSTTDTIATREQASPPEKLRTFESIDAAGRFLRSVGVKTFTVDISDAVSSVNVGAQAVRVLETTMRSWADDGAARCGETRACG